MAVVQAILLMMGQVRNITRDLAVLPALLVDHPVLSVAIEVASAVVRIPIQVAVAQDITLAVEVQAIIPVEDLATAVEGRATAVEGRTTAVEGRAILVEDIQVVATVLLPLVILTILFIPTKVLADLHQATVVTKVRVTNHTPDTSLKEARGTEGTLASITVRATVHQGGVPLTVNLHHLLDLDF